MFLAGALIAASLAVSTDTSADEKHVAWQKEAESYAKDLIPVLKKVTTRKKPIGSDWTGIWYNAGRSKMEDNLSFDLGTCAAYLNPRDRDPKTGTRVTKATFEGLAMMVQRDSEGDWTFTTVNSKTTLTRPAEGKATIESEYVPRDNSQWFARCKDKPCMNLDLEMYGEKQMEAAFVDEKVQFFDRSEMALPIEIPVRVLRLKVLGHEEVHLPPELAEILLALRARHADAVAKGQAAPPSQWGCTPKAAKLPAEESKGEPKTANQPAVP